MAVCTSITEWIDENVSKPVEDWENQEEKKCKKRHWYDPRSWFCWFITYLVKVIRWIVVTVVKAVITVVCRLISVLVGIFLDLLFSLAYFFKALFGWDKCALQDALAELGNVVGLALTSIGHVIIDPIVDWVNGYRLQNYVKEQIESRFKDQPDLIDALEQAFNVNSGVFGARFTCSVYRMYVDSQTMTPSYSDVYNLYGLHRDGLINLYELAGFDLDCSIFSKEGWYRPRPQTAVGPFKPGVPMGDTPPIALTRDGLKEYIDSGGQKGPHFRIYSMSLGNMGKRLDAAIEKGRQIGLILSFDKKEKEATKADYIGHYQFSTFFQATFLINEMGRNDENANPDGAREDLCSPLAVGIFGFEDKIQRGLTNNLIGTNWCGFKNGNPRDLTDSNTSGCSFIDDIPDELRKYVLIHELGHYFGLCHVDGFDRIMVSGDGKQSDLLTWGAIPNTLVYGGPRFIFNEAKRVWDFLLTNFPPDCFVSVSPGEIV